MGSNTAEELQKGPARAGQGIAATSLLSSNRSLGPGALSIVLPPTAVPPDVRPSFGMAERWSAEPIARGMQGQGEISAVPPLDLLVRRLLTGLAAGR